MQPTNEFISPQQDFSAQAEMERHPQMIENRFAQAAATAASSQNAPSNISPQTASIAPLSAPAASPATSPSRADVGVAAGQTRVASAQDVISSAPTPAAPAERKPEIGMEGYCPVTLIEEDRWVRGDKRWGARHRGRVYLFHSAAAQQKFLAEPDHYSPALTGYDPVVFAEDGRYTEGMRAHGLRYHGQIFLFQNEASLAKFAQEPNRYAEVVRLAVGADRKTIR
jgi:protein disulfide-isomerase